MTIRSRTVARLLAVLLALASGRSEAQDTPLYRDPDPTDGPRIAGPILAARPPSQDPPPAPPPSVLGPFQPSGGPGVPDGAPGPVLEPLLIVPPILPPLPPTPLMPTMAVDTVEMRRTTKIRGPNGVLGRCHDWFHDTFFGPSRTPGPSSPPSRRSFFDLFHLHSTPPAAEPPPRFFSWPSWPTWPRLSTAP